ncbi:MAG TPA: hypothetical protein VGO93_17710 [Candidatus Xenobia bacterium]|jgi:hypothetical protein
MLIIKTWRTMENIGRSYWDGMADTRLATARPRGPGQARGYPILGIPTAETFH